MDEPPNYPLHRTVPLTEAIANVERMTTLTTPTTIPRPVRFTEPANTEQEQIHAENGAIIDRYTVLLLGQSEQWTNPSKRDVEPVKEAIGENIRNITVSMALMVYQLNNEFGDTMASAALMNERFDIVDALVRIIWRPDNQFINMTIFMVEDWNGNILGDPDKPDKPEPVSESVKVLDWLFDNGFATEEELPEWWSSRKA